MEKIAVLFGGISAEHEVSKMSAKSVMENLDKEKFEIIPVEISKEGKFDIEKILSSDVVFPVLHGPGGEDGSMQGLCEALGKPYVGAGIEASALALDKIASKQIWQNLKLPIPSFIFFSEAEWRKNPSQITQKVELPVFVKPSTTGSSIGISKVKKLEKFKAAVEEALKYDKRIIVEEALEGAREFEVAVLGNVDLVISKPGEVIPSEEFYTYTAKYGDDSELIIPAKIEEKKIKEFQDLAEKAYRSLRIEGMARIDFFMKKDRKILLNEANTIPGFTQFSMYPKLMEASGISYKELLTRLIELAKER